MFIFCFCQRWSVGKESVSFISQARILLRGEGVINNFSKIPSLKWEGTQTIWEGHWADMDYWFLLCLLFCIHNIFVILIIYISIQEPKRLLSVWFSVFPFSSSFLFIFGSYHIISSSSYSSSCFWCNVSCLSERSSVCHDIYRAYAQKFWTHTHTYRYTHGYTKPPLSSNVSSCFGSQIRPD